MDEVSTPLPPRWPWFEPACDILMAVASVATAWCSYESSCWSGESGSLDAHSDKLQRQASAKPARSTSKPARSRKCRCACSPKSRSGVGHIASSYLANTVSLATVILFAATAEKSTQPRVRGASLAFAIALFLFAAVRTALLPVI